MLRTNFEHGLQRLREQIIALGSEVENNIAESAEILRRRDMPGALQLIDGDREINRKRIKIMNEALTLIATQQPMAGDLRLIASVLEISGELERINDYLKGIARISLSIGPEPIPPALDGLPQMAAKAQAMLATGLRAYSERDVELARSIPALDDEVDELFVETYRALVAMVVAHPESLELANQLEWAAHNLERAADRVTNICEWVVYTVTGEYVEMDSELEAPPPH